MSYLANRLRERAESAKRESALSAKEAASEYTDDADMLYPAQNGILKANLRSLADTAMLAAKELDKFAAVVEMLDEETLIRLDEAGLL